MNIYNKKQGFYFGMLALAIVSTATLAEDLSEPEVTITQDNKQQRVEEYRVNGQLYMVKVTPAIGLPYILLDHDGDGEFDLQDRTPRANPPIPQWILFEWK